MKLLAYIGMGALAGVVVMALVAMIGYLVVELMSLLPEGPFAFVGLIGAAIGAMFGVMVWEEGK